ncbi:MAG: putative LPS assembly protein LptD [Chloroherpetonaceae bacterium]|nr:putative LPS assembly protein LptD [Chloroherpetonaceae bacterium]
MPTLLVISIVVASFSACKLSELSKTQVLPDTLRALPPKDSLRTSRTPLDTARLAQADTVGALPAQLAQAARSDTPSRLSVIPDTTKLKQSAKAPLSLPSQKKKTAQADTVRLRLEKPREIPREKPLPLREQRQVSRIKALPILPLPAPNIRLLIDTALTVAQPIGTRIFGRATLAILDSIFAIEEAKARAGELDTIVFYSAKDSVVFDLVSKEIRLYGDAKIDYQEFKLYAPEVVLEPETYTLTAKSLYDEQGEPIKNPKFKDPTGEYDAETMSYNFKTKRGKVKYVETVIDNGIYRGATIKRQATGELNVEDAFYTTCNHPIPHFYFYCRQMKIIPGDRVIARPVVLYIEDVPVFVLPFAFFPTRGGRSSGIIVPRYGRDNFKGWNLAQGGYYFAINDYLDARIVGDIGFRGSWRLGGALRYVKRYDFQGGIQTEFERLIFNETGDPDFRQSDQWNLSIQHTHTFDPTMSLSANLNFVSGSQFSLQTFNPQNILSQQATSSATFQKTFGENERTINIGYQRTQNLRETNLTNSVSFAFNQIQFFPFRPRKSTGRGFLEQIGLAPNLNVSGTLNNTDTTFSANVNASTQFGFNVQQEIVPGLQYTLAANFTANGQYQNAQRIGLFNPDQEKSGAQLQYPISFSLVLPRYTTSFNFGLNLSTFLIDRTVQKFISPTTRRDTTVERRGLTGFTTYSLSAGVSSRLFGTLFTPFLEDIIGLKAVRHTLQPNISFVYNPDFQRPEFGNFATFVDTLGRVQRYNRYERALFSGVPSASQSINLNVQNIFEMKVAVLDTTKPIDDPARNEKVIQALNLGLSTGYNFAATEFNLAPLQVTAQSNTLAPALSLNASATFDFYSFNDSTGQRLNRFLWNDGKGVLRLTQASLQFSTNLSGERQPNPQRQTFADTTQPQLQNASATILPNDLGGLALGRNVDYDIPWNLSLNANLSATQINPLEPLQLDAILSGQIGITPTPNWKVTATASYSIRERRFAAPQIQINRDFHCWEMSVNWVPIGAFSSIFLQINVKAPQLRDIRIERRDTPQNIFFSP